MTPCYPKMVPLATQKEFGPILKTCPPGHRERCTCAKNQQCSTALWQVRRRARLQQRRHRMHPDRACSCFQQARRLNNPCALSFCSWAAAAPSG